MKRRASLRRTLLVGLLSAILMAWLAGVGLVFGEARQQVREVFDADLARTARVLASLLRHEVEEEHRVGRRAAAVSLELGSDGIRRYPRLAALLDAYRSGSREEVLDFAKAAVGASHRYESDLALLARYRDGGLMLRTPTAPAFPPGKTGFFTFSGPSGTWFGFGLQDAVTGFVVQVGEKARVRADLVNRIAGNSLTPFLLVLPLLGLIIWIGVGRALQPLLHLTTEVGRHVPGSLAPLPSIDGPEEVLPLVGAINGLLERVAMALEHERRFTADAAHELRTPLAALKAHAELARQQAGNPAVVRALNRVLVGADRTTHLVSQLLTQARADAGCNVDLKQSMDLSTTVRRVLSGLAQQAVEKRIDLSLDAAAGVHIIGNNTAIEVLLRNLVDNALRYTPVGGHVTVLVEKQGREVLLEVADNGPGLAPDEREHVFERFYRGSAVHTDGSGLGLSIVQRIAELHGAQVVLKEGLDRQGLSVQCRFASVGP